MQRGFTLIELLVVVLIIGILAAIAVPQYRKSVDKSRAYSIIILTRALGDSAKRYQLENGSLPFKFSDLDISLPSPSAVSSNACQLAVSPTGSGYSVSATDPDTIAQVGDYMVSMNTISPGTTLGITSARQTAQYGCYAIRYDLSSNILTCSVHTAVTGPENFCEKILGLKTYTPGNSWKHYTLP
jgi:prepilin-type N-terminal cleavage/methylation domain-containing protein